MRSFWLGLGVLALVLAGVGSAQAGKRIALVIGNSDYVGVPALANPANDAALMEQSLRGVDFQVISAKNVDIQGMRSAVREFGERLREAGKNAVGLFYFAGHGVQAQGKNYLLPLKAEIHSEADLELEALTTDHILSQMESAGNGLNLIILDASRDHPFESVFRSSKRGLARTGARTAGGMLIAYAAAPGEVAADGKGRHSPYTAALAKTLGEPGLTVEQVFRKVRIAVRQETSETQTPWEESSILGDFYFVPPEEATTVAAQAPAKPAPTGTSPSQTEQELMFWKSVSDSQDPAHYRSYLSQYPDGVFAPLARARLSALEEKPAAAQAEAPEAEPQAARLPEEEAPKPSAKRVATGTATGAADAPSAPRSTVRARTAQPAALPPEPEAAAAPVPRQAEREPAPAVNVARYPTLETPERVRVGMDFPVQVWLSTERVTEAVEITPGELALVTADGQLEITLPEGESWPLRVVLSAPGFEFVEGRAMAQLHLPRDGDSSVALFILRAQDSAEPERRVKLRATLWHDGAYIASIAREITVLGASTVVATRGSDGNDSESSEPLAAPLPEAPPTVITQSPGSPAPIIAPSLQIPDLTVHVTYDDPALLGRGQMILVSPHFGAAGQIQIVPFETPPETRAWLEQSFGRILDQTERTYRQAGTANAATLMKARVTPLLQGFGRELYKKFLPDGFKQVFWALAERGRLQSIQVFSNNPILPWELIRPVSADGTAEFDFLGLDFRLARWHVGGERQLDKPLQSLALQELVTLAPHYRGRELLPHQEAELAGLRQVAGYREIRGRFDDVAALMTRAPQGIVHFSGHGIVEQSSAGLAFYAIKLEDMALDVLTWRGLAGAPGGQHPFYFFNACDIGQAEAVANFVDGWAPAALEAGASGYIGGLWPLIDHAAADFAGHFYGFVKHGLESGAVPVAEALRHARRRFYDTGDPTFLAYAFYGDVNLQFVAE